MASTTEASAGAAFEDKFAARKRDRTDDPAAQNVRKGNNSSHNGSRFQKKKKPKRERNTTEASSEDVLAKDIKNLYLSRNPDLLQQQREEVVEGDGEGSATSLPAPDFDSLPAEGSEIEVEVVDISSTSDGLAFVPGDTSRIYTVPFTVPGDVVRVKVFRHLRAEGYSVADFISIVKPSPQRDDSRIQCKYFGACGGCQFQMLGYGDQLALKRRVVEKAFRNFADLPPELVPAVADTIGSPLQYGYRTKLTPHFDGPPGFNAHRKRARRDKNYERPGFDKCPEVGFMVKGKRQTMDIEECPIGTEVLNIGMTRERERMKEEYTKYKAGSTILLRESTTRYPKDKAPPLGEQAPSTVRSETEDGESVDVKYYETNHKNITTEYIGKYEFTNPAGSFFQNNNSILPRFTDYVRDHILPAQDPSSPSSAPRPKYLIDAYSGSGLFTITLSTLFEDSVGIDIAADSIRSAGDNAKRNGLEGRCRFIAADAKELFKSVTYNPDETVVVLDPPRKGCDNDFLRQLREFGPRRVLYVSCNVHTQARDVGYLVRGDGGAGARYEIESLVGFDFFPQTGHVEGVAILNRAAESK
ncbi:hypothetical protein N3K66_008582 [Trichothecium roseum]|uniref:Uncharacterized protein n=1 Tax=Trichothecium roseum TaxID=47278 RepID=A0ACC0UQT4_9HYPO|nr:hypothetical protein N3K66_008582 [Trichothecium roseum]